MKMIGFFLVVLSSRVLLAQTVEEWDFMGAFLLGGQTSYVLHGQNSGAYKQPAQNLTAEQEEIHLEGDALFEKAFSTDPNRKDFGLGPVFNHITCSGCHSRDGRGALPTVLPGNEWTSFGESPVFLRISVEKDPRPAASADNEWGAPTPVPGYSSQLFQVGSWGVREGVPGVGQARVWMNYEYSTFTYFNGQTVSLRKPVFKITNAYSSHIDLNDERVVKRSPRIGPPMIGLGLLEAIREKDILSIAKKNFSAQGVSGRPNWVFDIKKQMRGDPHPVSLGRFGLKANTPSVFHQALGALRGDIGVTNYAFPHESILGTALYEAFKTKFPDRIKDKVEATEETADFLVFYSQTLAVPTRRNLGDWEVRAGGRLFARAGCTTCHTPSFITGPHEIPQLAHQKIYPFTDLLLHDMGDGLADGRRDFEADGREWKTRPLWGIGQSKTVNILAGFLHDGRARTLEEAILWHGGEAKHSVDMFTSLRKIQRDQVIKFLNSL